jgi:hypothetical protein
MVHAHDLKKRMNVVTSDGIVIGSLDHLENDGKTLKLTRDERGVNHWLRLDAVASIEADGAHLRLDAQEAQRIWQATAPQGLLNY